MIKTYQSPKLTLAEDEVFVFGSNRDGGFHGCGSAGFASFGKAGNVWREFDYASKPNGWKGKWNVKGQSEGPMLGTEGKSYAIPTVTRAGAKRSIPLSDIKKSIEKFYKFAKSRPNLKFFVAQGVEGNLNGYSAQELAEIYSGEIPSNVYFDSGFASLLSKESQNVAQNSEHESNEKIEISSSHLKELHKIVHCKKGKFTQYIGRPPLGQHWDWKYGNPFEIGKDGDRSTVISKIDKWLETGESFGNKNATPERRQWILDHVHKLKDETLGCWCNYPKEDCHGRVLLELAEKSEPKKITLAVIGTAGRKNDYSKLTANHYWRMVDAILAVIKEESVTHLVSGGAAWADYSIYEIPDLPRKTYLPENPKDLSTAEYYHNRFFAKVSGASKPNGTIINHGGFLDRNLLVAKDADIFLAMTFGNDNEVKDGGTKHTVNAMLKQGKRGWHLDLNTLKLFCNAK